MMFEAADGLVLGIVMVVVICIGFGVGFLLKKFTPFPWLFWLGVFWDVAAAIRHVYKIYISEVKSYGEIQQRDEFIKGKIRQKK
ncbi:AtpZ/AtpI family protein [Campylobacter coli]|uniref:AtpZ/AtpI family protein n=1 Tax=Campylobacter coli TaxID=195 RepID=UPI0037FCC013